MRVEDLADLLAHLRSSFDLAADAEVTIEANPDTVDESSLRAIREAGYDRLSMGAQSFDPAVLAALERVHQPSSVRAAFGAARDAGYANVNLDLIYGAEGETLESWELTVRETVALAPEHVSAYALTIEPATPLGRAVAAGATPAPDPGPAGGDVHAGLRPPPGRRLPPLRDLELGAPRLRVPPQPRVLGTPAVRGAGCGCARLPRRRPLVERPTARAVPVDGRGGGPADRRERVARPVGRLPRGGVPAAPDPRGRARAAGSRRRGTVRSSTAVCSRTSSVSWCPPSAACSC